MNKKEEIMLALIVSALIVFSAIIVVCVTVSGAR